MSDEARVEAEPLNDAEGKALVAGLRQHMIGGIVTLTEDALDRLMATLEASEALRVEAERYAEQETARLLAQSVEHLQLSERMIHERMKAQSEAAAARSRSAQLEAALREVRDFHDRVPDRGGYQDRCMACGFRWPCQARRLVDTALALPVTEETDQ